MPIQFSSSWRSTSSVYTELRNSGERSVAIFIGKIYRSPLFLFIGPLAPSVPIDLFHTTQSSTEALISWLVPEISYTAEDYTIMYGQNQSFLNYSSETVTGNRDISSVNQIYSITLDELLPNTSYYYQLIAENTIGTNSTEVRAFMTPLPSMLITSKLSKFNRYFIEI